MKVKNIIYAVALALIMNSCCNGGTKEIPAEDHVAEAAEPTSQLSFLDALRCQEGKVRNGQFFSTMMTGLGLSAQEAYDLTIACDTVFNVKNLRVGNTYKAYYEGETLKYVLYQQDRTSDILFECQPPYKVSMLTRPVEVRQKYADVVINSSLWNDMRAAGASPLLILSLSDIYAWTIDFFGLQKGDRFRVLYEQKVCDGEVIAIDTVRYAVFSHDGKEFPMVMYNQHDGGNIWYEMKPSVSDAMLAGWKANPKTYYIAHPACGTHPTKAGTQSPDGHIFPLFKITGWILGNYTNKNAGIDKNWLPNDGIVNTPSMGAPAGVEEIKWTPGMDPIKPGVWHVLPAQNWDHQGWAGMFISKATYYDTLDSILESIYALPDIK